jgi:transcriptional regulator with XRE-family HTH domain
MDSKSLGHAIRKERIKMELTMAKFSEKVDISENFLGKLERGASFPSLETIVKIANTLGVGVDYLLNNYLTSPTSYLLDEISKYEKDMSTERKKFILEFLKNNIELFKNYDIEKTNKY